MEIVLLLRYSGQMWSSEMVWVFLHRKNSAIYIVEERMQTAMCLSSCRFVFLIFFLAKKSVKGSKIHNNGSLLGFFRN